jgi:hypothetical protein
MTSQRQQQFQYQAIGGGRAMSDTAIDVKSTPQAHRAWRKSAAETWQFRLLVALSFTVCLFGFALRRIAGRAPKGASYWSCVTEARSAAYAAAGYAFHA